MVSRVLASTHVDGDRFPREFDGVVGGGGEFPRKSVGNYAEGRVIWTGIAEPFGNRLGEGCGFDVKALSATMRYEDDEPVRNEEPAL
jgi:hypothetical protein